MKIAAIIVALAIVGGSMVESSTTQVDCNKSCLFLICQNNDTVKTISCTFNTTYYILLKWTPSTLNRTRVDLGSDVSVLTFNYSSLPSGYHRFDISYNYSLDSPFARLYCHCPFCSCQYSTTLEVEDNSAYVSQADIQLSGPTSQMKLEVYSKKAILFQGLVQRFSALLKEVEGSRKITY